MKSLNEFLINKPITTIKSNEKQYKIYVFIKKHYVIKIDNKDDLILLYNINNLTIPYSFNKAIENPPDNSVTTLSFFNGRLSLSHCNKKFFNENYKLVEKLPAKEITNENFIKKGYIS